MARICPTPMIFAPSIDGISYKPNEKTKDEGLIADLDRALKILAEKVN